METTTNSALVTYSLYKASSNTVVLLPARSIMGFATAIT